MRTGTVFMTHSGIFKVIHALHGNGNMITPSPGSAPEKRIRSPKPVILRRVMGFSCPSFHQAIRILSHKQSGRVVRTALPFLSVFQVLFPLIFDDRFDDLLYVLHHIIACYLVQKM